MLYQWAVILGTVAIVSYMLFGGFLVLSWTDVIQGLMMLVALMLVPVLAINSGEVEGWSALTLLAALYDILPALSSRLSRSWACLWQRGNLTQRSENSSARLTAKVSALGGVFGVAVQACEQGSGGGILGTFAGAPNVRN